MLGYFMLPIIIKEFDIGRSRGLVEVSLGAYAAAVAVAAAVVAVAAALRCRASSRAGPAGDAGVERYPIDPATVEVTTCRIDRSDPGFPQIRFEALVTNSTAVTGTVLLDVKFLDKDATVQRTDYPSDTSIRPGQKVKISGGALVDEDEFPDWTMTCEVASAEVYVPAT